MKFNILGDTHGRTSWKDLVRDDCVNIFVGDYFSPYEHIPFEELKQNFLDIIQYKKEHPETILLIGNHDEDHWHINEKYSRYDSIHFNEIKQLFEDNKDLFQLAYSIDNKTLVTHAGVSVVWYVRKKYKLQPSIIVKPHYYGDSPLEAYKNYIKNLYKGRLLDIDNIPRDGFIMIWNDKLWVYNNEFEEINATPDELAEFINNQWLEGNYSSFSFRDNSNPMDCYGEDPKQGPIWVRPETLIDNNIFMFKNCFQVVGHTQYPNIAYYSDNYIMNFNDREVEDWNGVIFFTDCLGYNKESLMYDSDINKFTVNR